MEVTPHKSLNSSKGIIRDRILKGESDENILEYLAPQGVTAVKWFKVKKGQDLVNTNTILITFNTVVPPKSLKKFLSDHTSRHIRTKPFEMFQLSEIWAP